MDGAGVVWHAPRDGTGRAQRRTCSSLFLHYRLGKFAATGIIINCLSAGWRLFLGEGGRLSFWLLEMELGFGQSKLLTDLSCLSFTLRLTSQRFPRLV